MNHENLPGKSIRQREGTCALRCNPASGLERAQGSQPKWNVLIQRERCKPKSESAEAKLSSGLRALGKDLYLSVCRGLWGFRAVSA